MEQYGLTRIEIHKGCFEIWLSARNREISKQYHEVFCGNSFDGLTVFHDKKNQDAIIECTLITAPDFENQNVLIEIFEQGAKKFLTAVSTLITIQSNYNTI